LSDQLTIEGLFEADRLDIEELPRLTIVIPLETSPRIYFRGLETHEDEQRMMRWIRQDEELFAITVHAFELLKRKVAATA
jgi:hypothetical protein